MEKKDYCGKAVRGEQHLEAERCSKKGGFTLGFFFSCEFFKFLKMVRLEEDEIRYVGLFALSK